MTVIFCSCSIGISNTSKASENLERNLSSNYENLNKLPQEYSPELAQKNGDVVRVNGIVYNVEKLDKLIENTKIINADMIRITTYTDEGDAIIYDLIKSAGGFELTVDNTRDKFSSKQDRKIREYDITDISKQNANGGTTYIAKNDKGIDIPFLFINSK
jgi:hypothetical protein